MKVSTAARLPATLLRVYGLPGISRRLRHEAEVRSGLMRRRTPPADTLPGDPGGLPRLRTLDLATVSEAYSSLPGTEPIRSQIVRDAEQLLAGKLRFYGGSWVDVGWPPRWRTNAETGYEHPRDVHWTSVSDHDLQAGDIKDVWEPSRFAWVYTLVRAWAVTGDGRYAEAVWEGVTRWAGENPPNCGPNWRCGQESSVRAAALIFILRALAGHSSATPERVAMVRRILLVTGKRVAATIGYAASQRNNHAISEAACLLVLGVVYPSWPGAQRWRRLGWRHLRSAVADQFYADGTYAQHSFTYQRFALQTLCWATVLAREAGARVPDEAIEAVRRSVALLHAVQDPATGYLPNLGPNDGAMLLPLTTCDYRDFRPALQAAAIVVGQDLLYEPGPWDEEALWLCSADSAPDATTATSRPARLEAPDGGLLVTRGPASMALLRTSPQWRRRPSQADDLHVDVWLGGVEVAGDAGTYRYTAAPPWNNGLAASRVHNTATIDGGDRLRRIGRFLSTDWPRSRVLVDLSGDDWQCWVVESDVPVWQDVGGTHRRLLVRAGDRVLVGDLVQAAAPHEVHVSWNLPADGVFEPDAAGCHVTGAGWSAVVVAPPDTAFREVIGGAGPQGWQAPTYGLLHARRTLTAVYPGAAAGVLVTAFDAQPPTQDPQILRSIVESVVTDGTPAAVQDLVASLQAQQSPSRT